jgi:PAS domain S-box-containing protein
MSTTDPGLWARVPEATLQKLARSARQSERAMVVGNRAGVIEWANDAWTRVTGYALDESVDKPVTGFLEHVDIDPGVIDFVAGCFQSGRVCELEIPLCPPRRDALWIQLRVEPLFDASSEASDFLAIATDLTEQKRAERGLLSELDLSELAVRVARNQLHQLGDMIEFDFALPANLPLVLADDALVERFASLLVARAVEGIGEGWGTITLSTGVLGSGLGPIFRGEFRPHLAEGHWAFLEVHDTGCFPSGAAWSFVTEPFLSTHFPADALRFAPAQDQLRAQGGELRVESSPVAGTSVLLLLPFAGDDSGWLKD